MRKNNLQNGGHKNIKAQWRSIINE